MDDADQELERGDEPVRHPLRRESPDRRAQPELTYTKSLEPPEDLKEAIGLANRHSVID